MDFAGRDVIAEHQMILDLALKRDFEACRKSIENHISVTITTTRYYYNPSH